MRDWDSDRLSDCLLLKKMYSQMTTADLQSDLLYRGMQTEATKIIPGSHELLLKCFDLFHFMF